MKRYLLLSGLIALLGAITPTTSIKAQWPVPKLMTTTSYGLTLDTVVNTGAIVTTPADGRVATWKTGITAQVVATKISGTVAGTLVLQGSMNGTNWTTIGSAASVTDATNTYTFNTTVRWYYYRISWTGTGTMSASTKSYLFAY